MDAEAKKMLEMFSWQTVFGSKRTINCYSSSIFKLLLHDVGTTEKRVSEREREAISFVLSKPEQFPAKLYAFFKCCLLSARQRRPRRHWQEFASAKQRRRG